MPLQEIKSKVSQLKQLISADSPSEIRLNANGGNSILLICPPEQELLFITELQEIVDQNKFEIVDVNRLFMEYVRTNKDEIEQRFDFLKSSLHQIFKSPEGEEGNDFYKFIIQNIETIFERNKIPILVKIGVLYGTGIDNIHIMENKIVMESRLPLIILYPATKTEDKLMFLNSRRASKYRCVIIN